MRLWFANKPGVARRQLTFFLRRQKESKQRKRRPDGLGPSASLRAASGARRKWGRARTRLRLRQSLALIHFRLRSSAQPDGWGKKTNIQSQIPNSHPECRKREAFPAREFQRTVMFARERSTRGHMKLPAIAQRGEGGVGGGSGESFLLSRKDHRCSVMQVKGISSGMSGEVPSPTPAT